MRSLWIWGDDIQLNYIRERGYDAGWLLNQERREASLNEKAVCWQPQLARPVTTYEWVDHGPPLMHRREHRCSMRAAAEMRLHHGLLNI